jgi:hypothetical protein
MGTTMDASRLASGRRFSLFGVDGALRAGLDIGLDAALKASDSLAAWS